MGFDLRRTPEASTLQAIATCDNILVCDTHFWHGRTIPCERPDCGPCRESVPYRTHVYVSAFDAKAREHFIFECTANAAKAFAEYRDANGTLKGCAFAASRPKGRKNSKVCILTSPVNLQKVQLPEAPNLIKALSVIWRLPTPAIETEEHKIEGINNAGGFATKHPTVRTKKAAIDRMREQPDNASDAMPIADILKGNGHLKPLGALT